MRRRVRYCVLIGCLLLAALFARLQVAAQESDLPPLMFLSLRFDNSDIEIDRLNVQSKRVLRLMPIEIQYYTQWPQWSPDGRRMVNGLRSMPRAI